MEHVEMERNEQKLLECCEQIFQTEYKYFLGVTDDEAVVCAAENSKIAELYINGIGGKEEFSSPQETIDLLKHLSASEDDEIQLQLPNSSVVLGGSGSGKTSLALKICNEYWKRLRNDGGVRPCWSLYIYLPDIGVDNMDNVLQGFLRRWKKFIPATHVVEYIRLLQNQNLLLVLDGCDEVMPALTTGAVGQQKSLWDRNEWNSKDYGQIRTIAFCRPEALSESLLNRRALFEGVRFSTQQPTYKEFYLQRFTQDQVEHYMHNFIHFVVSSSSNSKADERRLWWRNVYDLYTQLKWMDDPVQKYHTWFKKLPDLRTLAGTTPYMLSMIMKELPAMVKKYDGMDQLDQLRRVCATKTAIFDEVTGQWFKRQAMRDRDKFKPHPHVTVERLDTESLEGYYRAYAQNLAKSQLDPRTGSFKELPLSDAVTLQPDLAEPYQNRTLLERYCDSKKLLHATLFPTSPFSSCSNGEDDQDKEIKRKLHNLQLLRDGCLLQLQGETETRFRFSHRSLLEYFAARDIFDTILNEYDFFMDELEAKANRTLMQKQNRRIESLTRDLIQDQLILAQLADCVQSSLSFHEMLGEIVLKSAQHLSIGVLSSNAITILNRAGISFSGQDLRDIQVAGAKLPGCLFGSTDLRGANLSNVNLQNAYLNSTRFDGANLLGANFGSRCENENIQVREMLPYMSSTGQNCLWVASLNGNISQWNLVTMRSIKQFQFCLSKECRHSNKRSGSYHVSNIFLNRLSADKFTLHSNCSWKKGIRVRWLDDGSKVDGWHNLPVSKKLEISETNTSTFPTSNFLQVACSPCADIIVAWNVRAMQVFQRGVETLCVHVLREHLVCCLLHSTNPNLLLVSYIYSPTIELYVIPNFDDGPVATVESSVRDEFAFHPHGRHLVILKEKCLSLYLCVQGKGVNHQCLLTHSRDISMPKLSKLVFDQRGICLFARTDDFVAVWSFPDFDCLQRVRLRHSPEYPFVTGVVQVSADGSLLLHGQTHSLSVYELGKETSNLPLQSASGLPSSLNLHDVGDDEDSSYMSSVPGASSIDSIDTLLAIFSLPAQVRFVAFNSSGHIEFGTTVLELKEVGGPDVLDWGCVTQSAVVLVSSKTISLLSVCTESSSQIFVHCVHPIDKWNIPEAECAFLHTTHHLVVFSSADKLFVVKFAIEGDEEPNLHFLTSSRELSMCEGRSDECLASYQRCLQVTLLKIISDCKDGDLEFIYLAAAAYGLDSRDRAVSVFHCCLRDLSVDLVARLDHVTGLEELYFTPARELNIVLDDGTVNQYMISPVEECGLCHLQLSATWKLDERIERATLAFYEPPNSHAAQCKNLGLVALTNNGPSSNVSFYSGFELKSTISLWFNIHSLVFTVAPAGAAEGAFCLLVSGSHSNLVCIEYVLLTGSVWAWKILWSFQRCSQLMADKQTELSQCYMDNSGPLQVLGASGEPQLTRKIDYAPFCSLLREVPGTASVMDAVYPIVRVPGKYLLLSTDSWVISAAVKRNKFFDFVHAFLIVEGIWIGPRRFALRAELSWDKVTKQSFINTIPLDNFVEFQKSCRNYKAQQWNIFRNVGFKLLRNIQADQQRHLPFNKLKHNCAKWCVDQLASAGVKTKSAWYNFVLVAPPQILKLT